MEQSAQIPSFRSSHKKRPVGAIGRHTSARRLLFVTFFIVIGVGIVMLFVSHVPATDPSNYNECIRDPRSKILNSNPPQCISSVHKVFIRGINPEGVVNDEVLPTIAPSIVPKLTMPVLPTIASGIDWISYTNTSQRYKIDIPPGWYVIPDGFGAPGSEGRVTLLSSVPTELNKIPEGVPIVGIALIGDDKKPDQSALEYVMLAQLRGGGGAIRANKIVLSREVSGFIEVPEAEGEIANSIIVADGSNVYGIIFNYENDIEKDLVFQILATLRFVK